MNIEHRAKIIFRYDTLPWKVTRMLCLIVIALAVISSMGYLVQSFAPNFPGVNSLIRRFAINKEQTVPTLYSSITLMVA